MEHIHSAFCAIAGAFKNGMEEPLIDPPANTVLPVITADGGSTTVCALGATINKTSDGIWDPGADSYSYQWYLNGELVGGETGPSFSTSMRNPGETVFCEVIATNAGGSTPAQSNTITIVEP